MSGSTIEDLRAELGRCPFHDYLQPLPLTADANGVAVRLRSRPDFRAGRDSDVLHGGVVAALIDLAGSAAVALGTAAQATTIDLRVDYLRPATGPHFDACGRVLAGRRTVRADVQVRDAAGTVVAVGRGTWRTRPEAEGMRRP